jgi:hypothetical protein
MKTADELRSYFENEIKPGLEELEIWRKKVLKRAIIVDSIFAPPFIVAVIYLFYFIIIHSIDNIGFLFPGVVICIMSLFVFIPYVLAWKILRYKSIAIKSPEGKDITLNRSNELLYKNLVMGKLVKFISPDLEYSPEAREISGEEVLKGEIFPHTIFYPVGYIAEDFVEGKIGNVHIRFFEISGKSAIKPMSADPERPTAVDLGGFPYEVFLFHGMLGVVDFNKTFKGHTLVLPEARVRQSQWMRGSGRQVVRLEDPEFERYFSVYGTDQIAARYILSTSLMKRITDYRKKIGRKLSLSFTGNRFYVAVHHRKDQFEFSMYRSVYDFDRVKAFFNDLTTITDIVEDLNLNMEVWLKEGKKKSRMFEYDPDYKEKKEWIYKTLMYLFGYLGLHYLYIGYKLKALVVFLVTIAVFPYWFWYSIVIMSGYAIGRLFFPVVLSVLWYIFIWAKGHWIEHDSRGVRLEL